MTMELPNIKRFLGIDFGSKRIGLALCDPLKTFAYAFKTIGNDSRTFKELEKVVKEQSIEKIILGLPLKENGEEALITKQVLEFKKKLEKNFPFEVLLRDERYSSSIALEQIKNSVTKKSKRKEKSMIDSGAAAVILQDYLDELKTYLTH